MRTQEMSEGSPDVSIVVPVYNGETYLEEVLISVFSQKTAFRFEVIVIDSGSTDKSLEIIEKYPVRLHKIPKNEFGHGRTRNLGAKLGAGKYVIFLTQDATPASDYWLENLVKVLADDDWAIGSYSRQLPRPDCNPMEMRDITYGAPPISMVKKVDFRDEFQKKVYENHYQQFIVFSDVSSCIRKDIFDIMPFDEKILMVEDQEWCKRAIEAGYKVIYESSSAVYHSHNHSLKSAYKRHYDYGASLKKFTGLKLAFKGVIFYSLYESILDFFFIMLQRKDFFWKIKYILRAPLTRFALRYGLYKGLNS